MPVEVRSDPHTLSLADGPDGPTADGQPLGARLVPLGRSSHVLTVDGRPQVVTVEREGRMARVTVGSTVVPVEVWSATDLLLERFGLDAGDAGAGREVHAPMPGLVLRMLVAPGDAVTKGQGVVVLEAMKMENELAAPADGVVSAVHAAAGDAVGKNSLLVEIEPAAPGDAA